MHTHCNWYTNTKQQHTHAREYMTPIEHRPCVLHVCVASVSTSTIASPVYLLGSLRRLPIKLISNKSSDSSFWFQVRFKTSKLKKQSIKANLTANNLHSRINNSSTTQKMSQNYKMDPLLNELTIQWDISQFWAPDANRFIASVSGRFG